MTNEPINPNLQLRMDEVLRGEIEARILQLPRPQCLWGDLAPIYWTQSELSPLASERGSNI